MATEEGRMENRKEKMDERPHKKMDVWKNSMELAAEIYKVRNVDEITSICHPKYNKECV